MILLYVLLIVYIVAINFYAFMLVKSLKAEQSQDEYTLKSSFKNTENRSGGELRESAQTQPQNRNINGENKTISEKNSNENNAQNSQNEQTKDKTVGKLCITGALGGAIALYVSFFVFKYRRNHLLLMVLMPLLGVLNIYIWVLLFRSGFTFFIFK